MTFREGGGEGGNFLNVKMTFRLDLWVLPLKRSYSIVSIEFMLLISNIEYSIDENQETENQTIEI